MAIHSEQKKLKVAVIGGGIGGLSLAIGLLKHDNLDVQVYEAAHRFAEIGAGIAIGPNAQRALRLIGKETEEAFLSQATTNGTKEYEDISVDYGWGMGPHAGERIIALRSEIGVRTVHRAKFLNEFVALVPKERCHFGKKLETMTQTPKGVHLEFKDGSTAMVDAVLGCDGVHSPTRTHILGEDSPVLKPQFTHSVAYRGLVPMEHAVEVLGEKFARNCFLWIGEGGCLMHYPIDFGKTTNIVALDSTFDKWEGDWVQPAKYEVIEKHFAGWGELTKKVIAMLDKPETQQWALFDMPSAPTYYSGNVVMTGDAAHATTPYHGQGAAQAIEDAYVLGALLGHVEESTQFPLAFKAYDAIRRPRANRVVTTSRECGELCALRLPGVGADGEAIKQNLAWRMDWMWNRDIAGELDQCLAIYRKLVAGGSIDD